MKGMFTNFKPDSRIVFSNPYWVTGETVPSVAMSNSSHGRRTIIRHTAISNHFAYTKAEATTAAWAGNSPETVHRYYKGLVTPDQATAYWALTPEQMLAYTAETNTQPVDTTRAVVT